TSITYNDSQTMFLFTATEKTTTAYAAIGSILSGLVSFTGSPLGFDPFSEGLDPGFASPDSIDAKVGVTEAAAATPLPNAALAGMALLGGWGGFTARRQRSLCTVASA